MNERVVSRLVWVGIVVPALAGVVGAALQWSWAGQVPDPIAIHWGVGGQPDGAGALALTAVLTLAVTLLMPVLLALGVLPHVRRGERSWAYRAMAATSAGLGVFLAALLTWSVAVQRGLDSWTEAPSITTGLIVALGVGLIVGLLGWVVQPRQHFTPPPAAPAEPLRLDPGERAMWARTAQASPGVLGLLLGLALLLTVGAAVAFVIADAGVAAALAAAAALVGLTTAALMVFHVRVDHSGLEARALLGWPRLRVPLDDVASVEVNDVSGLAEFGGWGLRHRPGATGVVLRSGEALRVTRSSGRQLVVTVDDATTAAALLEALLQQRQAG